MAAPKPTGAAALARLRLAGVGFLVVVALLVGLTVALYQKTFTPVVKVSLKADRIGNQLSAPADVKLRGLIVGEVRAVSSTGDGATIDLALQPSKVKLIPKNIEAQLLPKTLFGEKFVELVLPESPSSDHIAISMAPVSVTCLRPRFSTTSAGEPSPFQTWSKTSLATVRKKAS